MNNRNNIKIKKYRCYSAKNRDLGIRDRNGMLMNGEHDVFVLTRVKRNGFVKVKTITSLENIKNTGERTFHQGSLEGVRNGTIIPIPPLAINSTKLSGINRKPIWIHKSKLKAPNRHFIYPRRYHSLIKEDSK